MRIRASSLPAHPDCPRRNLAKSFGHVVRAQGYELRTNAPSVGAAVGTATHAAAARLLEAKRDHGQPGDTQAAVDEAVAGFDTEIEAGAEWDDTTPNPDTAHKQIRRLTMAFARGVLPHVEPMLIETHMQADAGDGFTLDGHVDLITRDRWVRDLKTGALVRPYQAQLGGYSLLARSNAATTGVTSTAGVATDFIQRVSSRRQQPDPVETSYPVAVAENAALAAVAQIKRDVTALAEGGDPWAVPANPMSMMCSPKYCPAYGTDFCALGGTVQGGDVD